MTDPQPAVSLQDTLSVYASLSVLGAGWSLCSWLLWAAVSASVTSVLGCPPPAPHHAASAAPFLGPDLRHAAAQSRPEAGPWHSAAGTGEISVWRGGYQRLSQLYIRETRVISDFIATE